MPKENVVSFRLDDKKFDALTDRLKKGIAGVNSENQLCRKIIDDVLAGRLVYTNPADANEDKDLLRDGK
jgi:hypothetical protein